MDKAQLESDYQNLYRDRFAARVREKFAELTREAGVDTTANRKIADEVKALDARVDAANTRKAIFWVLMMIGFLAAGVGALGVLNNYRDREAMMPALIVCGSGLLAGVFMYWLTALTSRFIARLRKSIDAKKEVAYAQMESLNKLYVWDMPARLIEAVVPWLAFDTYFTAERHAELATDAGLDASANKDRTVLFTQSGVADGSPFVFVRYGQMEWEDHVYEGTKDISWNEWERDSEGKREKVRRSEKLHAYLTKPRPIVKERNLLVFGGDAGPTVARQDEEGFAALAEGTIDSNPEQFHNWSYDDAAKFFSEFNERYLKAVYFALAPLLAARQTRGHATVWQDPDEPKEASIWECEAMANALGAGEFQHPDCITRNVLKARLVRREDGVSTLAVAAYGFRGESHTHVESVFGGDRKYHEVEVEWKEFFPVDASNNMCLCEGRVPAERFRRRAANSKAVAERRCLHACRSDI